ncbi:RNA polymerase factor sigma-54 [Eubacteriaceae bacterium ES2]|nr:RNA polymerase factor sigma-54 [Eubacteriaceae bacterium ES2]
MKLDLNISQSQKLIITQEMRQAIEILQMTATELNNLIEKETMENPILDFQEGPIKGELAAADKNLKEPQESDVKWDEYIAYMQSYPVIGQSGIKPDENEYGFEKFSYHENTLHEYLHFQFSILKNELLSKEGEIGDYLIDCIDDNGYLIVDENYLLEVLSIDLIQYERVLSLIQTLDPDGVGARNIEECLSIQLQNRGYEKDSVYLKLVNHYLKDLAEHHYKRIEKETGLKPEEIAAFKAELKTLEPKPGREFSCADSVSYIIPDGKIEIRGKELLVTVNEISAPKLHISPYYQKMLQQEKQGSEASEYLSKKMNGAVFLIKSIEQRRQTIKNVIEAIASYQKEFFFNSKTGLKALTLKDIAEIIEMHESTISRAIRGKYIETPNGTLPLKFFFTRGFSDGQEDLSSEVVKNWIKELISQEDKKKPLSDQKIAELLKAQKIDVARRTVAKYREALNIESSSKRKEVVV